MYVYLVVFCLGWLNLCLVRSVIGICRMWSLGFRSRRDVRDYLLAYGHVSSKVDALLDRLGLCWVFYSPVGLLVSLFVKSICILLILVIVGVVLYMDLNNITLSSSDFLSILEDLIQSMVRESTVK